MKGVDIMKKYLNNKGVTIPVVLIALMMSTILGFASLGMINSQTKFNVIDDSGKKAIEYAEAGYNQYLWHLNDDVNFYSTQASVDMQKDKVPFMDGYYKLEVTIPSGTDRFITIKSTGWTDSNPEQKRTIIAKIRKKQFVHHVYVSDSDGDQIWWTAGDESHGPYHTNRNLYTRQESSYFYNSYLKTNVYYPVFFDTVSYSGTHTENITNTNYKNNAYQNGKPEKVDKLEFPASNSSLKVWAEKDNAVYFGRTCIYLDGENLKIRNQNADPDDIITKAISSIKNKVLYVETIDGSTGKFDINAGNIFISGELKGKLTIAAANNIYITYDDPTNWYDYKESDLADDSVEPNQPPKTFYWNKKNNSYPEKGGITYKSTTFTPSKLNDGYWEREATGKDMLGLVANKSIFIMHYGWPKKAFEQKKVGTNMIWQDTSWTFEWQLTDNGNYVEKQLSAGTYYNIKIRIKGSWGRYTEKTYATLKVGDGRRDDLKPGKYDVWEPKLEWTTKNYTYDVGPKDAIIHSALFAVNDGFGFEEYNKGARRGDITLWGNITQKVRLAVGTIGSTGYNKLYAHDTRMFYEYPPHILEPTNVGWEIHDWKETSEHVEVE